MRRIAHITVIALVLVGTTAIGAAAQSVEISEVNGLVRIHDGSGSWSVAEPGDTLNRGMAVSTGFDGKAVIQVGPASVAVEPVTYLTLSQLTEEAGVSRTQVGLSFGRVNAEVKRADSLETNFEVRSPESTASVKGTEFAFDGSRLWVSEGDVSLRNRIGQSHSVRAGQRSSAYGFETIQSVEAYFNDAADLR
jgi:hypothetical protein